MLRNSRITFEKPNDGGTPAPSPDATAPVPGTPEADVIIGGPALGAQPPELVEVDINGTKYQVDKGTADAISAQQKTNAAAITEAAAIPEPTPAPAPPLPSNPTPVAAPADGYTVIAEQFFTDTPGAIKAIEKLVSDKVSAGLAEAYTADQSQRDFWLKFYETSPDLKGEETLVQAAMNSNWAGLKKLNTAKAIEKLSDLTRKEITRIARKAGAKTKGKGEVPHTEAASTPAIKPVAEVEPDAPATLGSIIKIRAAARTKPAAARASAQ